MAFSETKEYRQAYYKKNKEKIRNLQDTYKNNQEWRKAQQLRVIKHRAIAKGLEFDLKVSDLIWPSVCPLLGIEITYEGNKWSSPSVDRVDSTKGYTKENCRIISTKANSMKSDATREEMKIFINNIIKYMEGG